MMQTSLRSNRTTVVALAKGSRLSVTGEGSWNYTAIDSSGLQLDSGSYSDPDVIGPFNEAGTVNITPASGATLSYDTLPTTIGTVSVTASGQLVGPDGTVIDVGAAPRVIHRLVAGVPETTYTPHPDRIKRLGGTALYNFSAAVPTVTNGTAALSADYAYRNRQSYALTANGAGNMSAAWTVSLPAGSYNPDTHYVLAIYNGGGTTSGFSISLNGAGGRSQSWSISGGGFRPGWNLIFLCSPTDFVARGLTTAAGYGNQNGVVNVGTSGAGGLANNAITSISISFFGPANGVVHYVDCIELSTVVKPMVCWTWDQSYTDVDPNTSVANPFLNTVVPAFAQAGVVGGVRFHGAIDNSTQGMSNVNAALDAGWEPYNGTLTRQTPVTAAADMYWQYGVNEHDARSLGVPASRLGSPPGNNSSSDSILGLATLPKIGIDFSKGVSHSAIVSGVMGHSNPLSLGVTSFDGKASAEILALTDAAIACGTHLLAFSHYTQSAQTPAELLLALQGLKARQDAGLIDVVGPNTFVRGMRGEV